MTARDRDAPVWRSADLLDRVHKGDAVQIDHDYITGDLQVMAKTTTIQGRVIVVTSDGGSVYRLRQTGPDDELAFEKYHGDHSGRMAAYDFDNWTPHLRVKAARVS